MNTITLDEIVREYMIGEGKESFHDYPRYLQMAARGLKEMNTDVSAVPMVSILEVEDGGRATLPQDLIRPIRIGFAGSDGRFIEIYSDNTLIVGTDGVYSCATDTDNLSGLDQTVPISSNIADLSGSFRNGEVIGRQYGNVGGSVFSYRMDWARGVAEFSSNISGQVVLEYLGDPQKVDGQYIVHPFLIEPILAWLAYSLIRFKKSVSPNEKNYAFQQYVNKKRHARIRFASESIGSIINASRKTFNGSAKF
jgi:hypothetical protein